MDQKSPWAQSFWVWVTSGSAPQRVYHRVAGGGGSELAAGGKMGLRGGLGPR